MPNEYYNAPYLDEAEHTVLDHTGIPGVGGGSSVNDFLQISGLGGLLTTSVESIITLSPTAIGGIGYKSVGTAITWDSGNPTHIDINVSGSYDIHVLTHFEAGTAAASIFSYYNLTGANTNYPALLKQAASAVPGFSANDWTAGTHVLGHDLDAGDFIELIALQQGNGS